MAAVINQPVKLLLAQKLLAEDSDSNMYIAIGRSNDWDSSDTAPNPIPTEREERNLRLAMQSMKQVTASSLIVPRNVWASGAIYSAYNDNQEGNEPDQPYYVMTDENQIYICLQQAKTDAGVSKISTVKPTGTALTPFETADGYIWKFLYTIDALNAAKFVAANFHSVEFVEDSALSGLLSATQLEQLSIQNNARDSREVLGAIMTNNGSGYVTAPAVTVIGDGSDAKLQATVNGGQISKLELFDSSGVITTGSGYNYAEISIAPPPSGTQATARAILGPKSPAGKGLGNDPRVDLRARGVMFNTKPNGAEGGDFLIDQDFRQIGILRNPTLFDSSAPGNLFTEATANALFKMQLSSIAVAFTIDNTMEGGTSSAQGIIDKIDSDIIYYHQDETTGFTPFDSAESVTETTGSGSGVIQHPRLVPEIDPFSGDLLYIDNRAAITRADGQEDDLKIVIQI